MSEATPENNGRDPKTGRFMPGNKQGKKRVAMSQEVLAMLEKACPKAIAVLIEIMEDETAKHRDRAQAANSLLDRTYGKPTPVRDDNELEIPTEGLTVTFTKPKKDDD